MYRMPALSIWAPYPQLIADEQKVIETRTWCPRYRGDVAIHVAASREVPSSDPVWQYTDGAPHMKVRGVVIAVATLVETLEMRDYTEALLPGIEIRPLELVMRRTRRSPVIIDHQWPFGTFKPGMFGLVLDCVRVLKNPVLVSGGQKLWRMPVDATHAVLQQVG
jgi:hypothetical protein